MDVLIVSKEITVMRMLQTALKSQVAGKEELTFHLEMDMAEARKLLPRVFPSLLILCNEEDFLWDSPVLAQLGAMPPKMQLLFVVEQATDIVLKALYRQDNCYYIERPLEPEKLQRELGRILERIGELRHIEELEKNSRYWREHEKFIRQQFWLRFLNGKAQPKPADMIREARMCGISIRLSDSFHLVQLSRKLLKKRTLAIEEKTRRELLDGAEAWFGGKNLEFYIAEQLRPFVIVKNYDKDGFLKLLEEFNQWINEHYGLPLCCYYDLDIYCEELFAAAKCVMITERESVPKAPGIFPAIKNVGAFPNIAPSIPPSAEELLENGQFSQFQKIVRDILWQAFRNGSMGRNYLKMMKMDVQQLLHGYLKKRDLPGHCLMFNDDENDVNVNAHISIDSFVLWMEAIFQKIPSVSPRFTVVEAVKQWIREHIYESLTRQGIADHFSLNADYLGKIFKKETGEAIGSYIAMEKIKEAKRCLATGAKSVSEICTELGYENFSYFSKTFKKYTGMSPREYRIAHSGSTKADSPSKN